MTSSAVPPPSRGLGNPEASTGTSSDLAEQLSTARRRAIAADRARLQAEERAQHAEQSRSDLEARLAHVVAELEILRGQSDAQLDALAAQNGHHSPASSEGSFSLFQDQLNSQPSLAADGSDPGVLPVALAGTAVVAFMVVVLAAANGRLFAPFGLAMVVIAGALAYFAWQTRVERIDVKISSGGIVYVERSSTGALRYDLSSNSTQVTMNGQPGTTTWDLTFARGNGRDPFTVTAAMVNSVDFVERVRAFRPDL